MSREYDLEEILAEYAGQDSSVPVPGAALSEPAAEDAPSPAADGAGEESIADADDSSGADGVSEEELPEAAEAPERQKPLPGDAGLTQVFRVPEVKSSREPSPPTPEELTAENEAEPAPGKKPKKKKRKKKESVAAKLGFGLLSLIFAAVSLAVLSWSLLNLHPDTAAPSSEGTRPMGTANLVSRLDAGLNNSKANALSDITYIPKHYSIPEGDTVAPKPREANFGSVSPDNAAQLLPVIEQARNSGLLEGQDMIFSPDLNFRPDTDIQYYYDETILTILWKELINGNTVSCCEVKIADASQFRRKFVDDTFGSSNKLFATSLAASVNAVVAMNADFYMFRDFGIVVYDRDLYRFSEANYTGSYKKYNCTDTMFVTDQGDLLFWHRLEEATPDEMKAWIDENHIVFSIAFGPVLVENGQLQVCDWYPAGEIDRGYSRAGIGQKDHLHYFYMSLNHSPEMEARWTVNQFGEHMYERGLQQAYCLDGGQTSEIVWRGAPFNYIDFGGEREVSDIIYFATAIPETEGTP